MASARANDPQTWNRYAYCGNNPLNRVDPNGLDWWYKTGQKNAQGGVDYIPEWHKTDPGKGYERWLKSPLESYVFQNSYTGLWDALLPNGVAKSFNSAEDALAEYSSLAGSGLISVTPAQRDFWTGVSHALLPVMLVGAPEGVDTTSRDYRAGLLFGGVGFAGATTIGSIGSSLADDAISLGNNGTTVYRVWGGKSGPWGESWTTVNPATVPNFRSAAGLPDVNEGRFVSEGILRSTQGVTSRGSLILKSGQQGGLPELVIKDPESRILLRRVSGVNPQF